MHCLVASLGQNKLFYIAAEFVECLTVVRIAQLLVFQLSNHRVGHEAGRGQGASIMGPHRSSSCSSKNIN